MCDFKPGDEVVCIAAPDSAEGLNLWQRLFYRAPVHVGRVYVVSDQKAARGLIVIRLKGVHNATPRHWFNAQWFRKVQRRDLTAWLSQSVKNTDKLDKPHRAPNKERA